MRNKSNPDNVKRTKLSKALFGWMRFVRIFFNNLLKKTLHDDKVPTDEALDEDIELLSFYMKHVWPLINHIAREKTINFFKYKLKRVAAKLFILCVLLTLSFGVYWFYSLNIEKPKVVVVEKQKQIINGLMINTDIIFIPAEKSELTKDNLDYFASEMDIKYWYYVRGQIISECGFSSDLCLIGHNLFGMRFPGQRETTAIGEYLGHAKYKHWVYSLYDYKLWQKLRLESAPMKQGEDYPQWLKRIGYAESEEYMQKIRSVDWYGFKPDKNK